MVCLLHEKFFNTPACQAPFSLQSWSSQVCNDQRLLYLSKWLWVLLAEAKIVRRGPRPHGVGLCVYVPPCKSKPRPEIMWDLAQTSHSSLATSYNGGGASVHAQIFLRCDSSCKMVGLTGPQEQDIQHLRLWPRAPDISCAVQSHTLLSQVRETLWVPISHTCFSDISHLCFSSILLMIAGRADDQRAQPTFLGSLELPHHQFSPQAFDGTVKLANCPQSDTGMEEGSLTLKVRCWEGNHLDFWDTASRSMPGQGKLQNCLWESECHRKSTRHCQAAMICAQQLSLDLRIQELGEEHSLSECPKLWFALAVHAHALGAHCCWSLTSPCLASVLLRDEQLANSDGLSSQAQGPILQELRP